MKNFLDKHVLFPRQLGLQPYFYLVFFIPAMAGLASVPARLLPLFIGLFLVFLKVYRDGYRQTRWFPLQIATQLALAGFMAVNPWSSMFGLQIFTGFEIGFSRLSDRRFRGYLAAYYPVALLSYGLPFLRFGWTGDLATYVTYFITVLFVFGCPILGKAISRSYSLTADNKALEARVKQLERERIAYDLHDSLGQAFSTITLEAELAGRLMERDPDRAKSELSRLSQQSRASLTMVRDIVSDLRQPDLAAILDKQREVLALSAIRLSVEGLQLSGTWPVEATATVAAVTNEALTNVVRHSAATEASVSFDEGATAYLLTVRDNGRGIADSPPSHGIAGMTRRVTAAGGTLDIRSDAGVTLQVSLPKDKKGAADD